MTEKICMLCEWYLHTKFRITFRRDTFFVMYIIFNHLSRQDVWPETRKWRVLLHLLLFRALVITSCFKRVQRPLTMIVDARKGRGNQRFSFPSHFFFSSLRIVKASIHYVSHYNWRVVASRDSCFALRTKACPSTSGGRVSTRITAWISIHNPPHLRITSFTDHSKSVDRFICIDYICFRYIARSISSSRCRDVTLHQRDNVKNSWNLWNFHNNIFIPILFNTIYSILFFYNILVYVKKTVETTLLILARLRTINKNPVSINPSSEMTKRSQKVVWNSKDFYFTFFIIQLN